MKFSSTTTYAPPKIEANWITTRIIALDDSAVFVIYPTPKPKLIARKTCVNKIINIIPRWSPQFA